MRPTIVRVALPVPIDKQFDYQIPPGVNPVVGGRVSVPFGPKTMIGLVTELDDKSDFDFDKLKTIKQVLDT